MAGYMGMNPPGLRVCRVSNPPLRERKRPPGGGREMFGEPGKTHLQNPETRHNGLSSSSGFHEPIGLVRVLHSGKQLFCLTMDTLHQQLVGIGDLVALQDRFSQPAQDASFNNAKPESVDQQGSGFPDDFILEEELCWLEGMVGKVLFQFEEWIEPFAITCEYRRAVAAYGEGGCLHLSPYCSVNRGRHIAHSCRAWVLCGHVTQWRFAVSWSMSAATGSRSQHGETARVDEIACVIKQDAGKDQDVLD